MYDVGEGWGRDAALSLSQDLERVWGYLHDSTNDNNNNIKSTIILWMAKVNSRVE